MKSSQSGSYLPSGKLHTPIHQLTFLEANSVTCIHNNEKSETEIKETIPFTTATEDIQMAKKQMKRCSTSLVIGGMQIKTTMRYHLTLVRMDIIKKSTKNTCWGFPGGTAVENLPANAGDTG